MINNNLVKEKIMKYGANKLEDIELISTVIGEAGGKSLYEAGVLKISDINKYGINELIELTGIGKNKAIQLLALYELAKRNIKQISGDIISSPNDVYNLCKDLANEEQEVLRLFCLNTKNKIILSKDVFKGGINSSIVDVRVLLKEALKINSSSLIICHNHPSGDPSPSKEDNNITIRLKDSCKLIGLDLLDHIVIGKEGFYSFKEKSSMWA